jgi:hypothetical protein
MDSMPGTSDGTQHTGLFAERIAKGNNQPGLRRGQRGFRSGAEGAGDGLVKSGSEQRARTADSLAAHGNARTPSPKAGSVLAKRL